MRVISGSARGRKLDAPAGSGTRPITDRAKEGVFNMVDSLGGVVDASVVDLFAGSGSFGIECLSRGARSVVFVERDRGAAAVLKANVERLGFDDRSSILVMAVERAMPRLPAADVAFCDPPYADDPWADLLENLSAELLVGHADFDIDLPERWVELRRRTYGRARIVIAEPASGPRPPSETQAGPTVG